MAMEIAGTVRTSALTLTDGKKYPLVLDASGNLKVVVSGATGGQAASSASQSVVPASDAGPTSVARLLSAAATTNATSVKASAGSVFKIVGDNTAAAKKYLKLYNKASAPTVGTDTPVMTICLPASATFSIDLPALYFATGIAYAITGAAADADTTALSAGDIACLNIVYK